MERVTILVVGEGGTRGEAMRSLEVNIDELGMRLSEGEEPMELEWD